jgi:4-amino-4-deoxy-L-arabinose transferase-like glycosyltransferase
MYLLVFSICFALILSAGFLHRYGNIPRQHPLVTISVLIAWSFSFLIVFTIPLDITAVSGFFGVDESFLLIFGCFSVI